MRSLVVLAFSRRSLKLLNLISLEWYVPTHLLRLEESQVRSEGCSPGHSLLKVTLLKQLSPRFTRSIPAFFCCKKWEGVRCDRKLDQALTPFTSQYTPRIETFTWYWETYWEISSHLLLQVACIQLIWMWLIQSSRPVNSFISDNSLCEARLTMLEK